jgi:hypothetical protein
MHAVKIRVIEDKVDDWVETPIKGVQSISTQFDIIIGV